MKYVGIVIDPDLFCEELKYWLLKGRGDMMDQTAKNYYNQHKEVCNYQYECRYHES